MEWETSRKVIIISKLTDWFYDDKLPALLLIIVMIIGTLFLIWFRFEPIKYLHRLPCLLLWWNQAIVQTYQEVSHSIQPKLLKKELKIGRRHPRKCSYTIEKAFSHSRELLWNKAMTDSKLSETTLDETLRSCWRADLVDGQSFFNTESVGHCRLIHFALLTFFPTFSLFLYNLEREFYDVRG